MPQKSIIGVQLLVIVCRDFEETCTYYYLH